VSRRALCYSHFVDLETSFKAIALLLSVWGLYLARLKVFKKSTRSPWRNLKQQMDAFVSIFVFKKAIFYA
jgi:hypothetical protein